MKRYKAIILVTAFAALLASCGTQIQLTEAIPAKMHLRRGTTLIVNSDDDQMTRAFVNKIAQDGFYKQPGDGNITAYAHLNVRDIDVNRRYSDNGVLLNTDLSATAEVFSGYRTAYRERYCVGVPIGSHDYEHFDDACDSFANIVMNDLTPHERAYYVRVRGSSKNPYVGMAAKYAKVGDWNSAASNALQALKNDPNDPEAYYMAGIVLRRAMKYSSSTLLFQKAYSLKPKGKYRQAIRKNAIMAQNDEYVKQQLSE